jgi:hypothetical protein
LAIQLFYSPIENVWSLTLVRAGCSIFEIRMDLQKSGKIMFDNKYLIAFFLALAMPSQLQAQAIEADIEAGPSYSDIVDLSLAAQFVIRAEIRKQAVVEPERAPGLAPGFARLYIEARTQALIAGRVGLGELLTYLVDVPLHENGKPPKLKKQVVLLFARPVAGSSTAIQLVGAQGQFPYSPEFESRIRPVLADLVSPDSPPMILGVRDALSVPGNLAGESETQIFLETDDGSPVSITVLRRPGREPAWGVSWGEIIDASARPPAVNTIAWYRLACSLPERLPAEANLARDSAARAQAARDYVLVIGRLGPCGRSI